MFKNLKAWWRNRKGISGKVNGRNTGLSPTLATGSSDPSKPPRHSQTSNADQRQDLDPNGDLQPENISHEAGLNPKPDIDNVTDTSSSSIVRKNSARSITTARSKSTTRKYIPRVDGEEDLFAQHQDHQLSLVPSRGWPPKVDCRLVLFLDRKGPYDYFEDVQVAWQRETTARFDEIEDGAQRWLLDKYCTHEHSLYKIAGTCQLYRVELTAAGQVEVEVDSQVLEKKRQWNIVLKNMLENFFSNNQNHGKKCKVELRWEYSSLIIKRVDNESYANAVRETVEKKMQKNWAGDLFLPRGDDRHIFTRNTIENLIDDDKSLSEGSSYRAHLMKKKIEFSLAKFKEEVWVNGHRILAVCIYSDVPLQLLHRLMLLGLTNSDLPLKELPSQITALTYMSQSKCKAFLKDQGSFVPHSFEKNPGPPLHTKIDDGVVIPIWFDTRPEVRAEARLGEGTYGEVYRAKIWPGHHIFSPNRDTEFAVKVWKTWDDDAERLFKKEEVALRKLHQIQCGNIVLHHASWSQGTPQGRRFYMLFPLARFNLADFMSRELAPDLDKDHVSWFFGQLFDLIDTVEQIHTIKPLEADGLGTGQSHKTGGYHHDLKPSNILAFYDREDPRPVFKISDFGVAKLGMELASMSKTPGRGEVSLRSINFGGDAVYSAPDFFVYGEVGRKADIWSLGCCFLEMLSWNFGLGGKKLEDFYHERFKVPRPNRQSAAAYFYHDKEAKTVALTPAVKTRLLEMNRICAGRGQFEVLIKQIELMLTLTPDTRQSAAEFRSAFRTMHRNVGIELAEDPDRYLRRAYLRSSAAPLAPITANYDHSIDDRHVEAPFSTSPADRPRSQSATSSLKKHARDPAQYGEQFLSPDVDESSATNRPRSLSGVSIEVTDYSTPIETRQPPGIIGGLDGPPTPYEIPTVSRPRGGSDSGSEVPE